MIGKAASSSSFSKTIKYIFAEAKKAEVVFGNFIEAIKPKLNLESLILRFNQRASLNSKVKQPCYHVKLSPAINDKLSDSDWAVLASKLLEKLEFKTNQAIGILHRDTYFPDSEKVRTHLHLVVNKINHRLQSCSSNLYYDYYKIEQVLRDFEVEKNLTRVGFEYGSTIMYDRKPELESTVSIGDLLRDVDKTAESIKTREPELNGFDLASYGITSASSIAKVALALLQKAENRQQRKDLLKVVTTANKIPISEISQENQKKIAAEVQKKLTPGEIYQFIENAQKFLEGQIAEISLLPSRAKEKSLSDDNLIFEQVKKYLALVEGYQEKTTSRSNNDTFKKNGRSQFELTDTPDYKSIAIVDSNNQQIYRAETIANGKWQVQLDKLEDRQRDIIARLPQNPEQGYRRNIGRKLATCLADHMTVQNVDRTKWKFDVGEGKKVSYSIQIAAKTKEGIELIAKDKDDSLVFSSQIDNTGRVNIRENEIPLLHLERFDSWYKQHYNANRNNEQQNQRDSRQR